MSSACSPFSHSRRAPSATARTHGRNSRAATAQVIRIPRATMGSTDAPTPEEAQVESKLAETSADEVPVEDEYDGPDPEDDPKGDGSDEDQGT